MSTSSTFTAADGDGYELQMGRWSRVLARAFLDFAGTADDDQVIDVGCGTGSLTRELGARMSAGRITGVDFSEAYVEYASRRNDDARVTYRQGDACQLTFADGAFDRVLSLLMLHFVPDAGRAIAQLRRVARPGAVVAAAVWDARGGMVANRMFFDTAAILDPEGGRRRARNLTRPMTRPGELSAAWGAAGLRDVSTRELTIRMEYRCFDDYWTPLTGRDGTIADYVRTLSVERRDALRAGVRDAYLDGEADGPRSYCATAWAVRGTAP